MPIVSDSSGLILFAAVGRLDLLQLLFREVRIPVAVWDEVVARGGRRPGAAEVERSPWIRVEAGLGSERVEFSGLGRGEAAAIRLATALRPSDGLLLDDQDARRAARAMGLRVTGSAGVLLLAKGRGFIPAVEPLLSQLRVAGLYLSDAVARDILREVDEA